MSNQAVFTPGKIGNVEMKNRVIFPSMCTFFNDAAGYVGEDQYSLVRALAQGGTGLIIVPGSPHGKPGSGRPALSDDCFIPGWRAMADVAHQYGAKLFCQLHPAAVQAGRDKVVKKVEDYTKDHLNMLVESYAMEAKRCMAANVDGVEIHGAHAHEIAQFMSPHYNKRTDEYGGDTKGRARYSLEIVRAIKKHCGREFPVVFRISGDELVEGGRKLPETIEIIKLLLEAGIDAVHVSIGMPESEEYMCAPMDVGDCFNADAALAVKQAIGGKIPVISVGRIATMDEAEGILEAEKADFTAIGRAQLADPALVNKYAGINSEPVCRCVGCNQGCRNTTVRKKIRCMQNALVGYENECSIPVPAKDALNKKVMIVGAGPAGLQAAMTLAQHGLKPVVYEKDDCAGGLIRLASKPPFKAAMERVTVYRVEMLKQLGVEIRYRTTVDAALIAAEKPDIVVVATGSLPMVPPIPGIDSPRVYTGDQVIENEPELGRRVAIIGGGLIGCETAETLVTEGKDVELFEMMDDVATELTASRRTFMLRRLHDSSLRVHTCTVVKNIALPAVTVVVNGEEQKFEGFDSVVVAAGRKPENTLMRQLKDAPASVRVLIAGDASKPSLAIEAIHSGTMIAMQILRGNI